MQVPGWVLDRSALPLLHIVLFQSNIGFVVVDVSHVVRARKWTLPDSTGKWS